MQMTILRDLLNAGAHLQYAVIGWKQAVLIWPHQDLIQADKYTARAAKCRCTPVICCRWVSAVPAAAAWLQQLPRATAQGNPEPAWHSSQRHPCLSIYIRPNAQDTSEAALSLAILLHQHTQSTTVGHSRAVCHIGGHRCFPVVVVM